MLLIRVRHPAAGGVGRADGGDEVSWGSQAPGFADDHANPEGDATQSQRHLDFFV